MNALTLEQVRELLDYDPNTGLLTWRKTRTGTARSGTVAGTPNLHGYVVVRIYKRHYQAHRLAWLLSTGAWPTQMIDHIDGIRTNNRISNLRDVSRTTNLENRHRAQANSRSGLLGVCQYGNSWAANIRVKGKQLYLGRFDTPEAAHAAYLSAKRNLHEGCTI